MFFSFFELGRNTHKPKLHTHSHTHMSPLVYLCSHVGGNSLLTLCKKTHFRVFFHVFLFFRTRKKHTQAQIAHTLPHTHDPTCVSLLTRGGKFSPYTVQIYAF